MKQKFTVQASHFQIGLWDADSNDSYPEFPDDSKMEDLVIFGPKGVVVTTEGFADIDVCIVSKEESKEMVAGKTFLGKGRIHIGNRGVEVGNIITDSIHEVPWKSGELSIEIWGVEFLKFPTSVIFVLGASETSPAMV